MTDEPIKYLLQTHNHQDHSSGGGFYREEGAQIVAHFEAVQWMEAYPNPNIVIPDVAWNGTQHIITLGNTTVEVTYETNKLNKARGP